MFNCNCKLTYTIPNTLKSLIKKGKDQLEPLHNQNIDYKISYDDCNVSYQ